MSVPIGRGTYRGSSSGIRNINTAHFRAARPESSLGATGKQGMIKSNIFIFYLNVLKCF